MIKNIGISIVALMLSLCALTSFAISPGAGQAQMRNNMQQMEQNKQLIKQQKHQQEMMEQQKKQQRYNKAN